MPGKNKHLTYDDIVRVLFSIARDEWIVRMFIVGFISA